VSSTNTGCFTVVANRDFELMHQGALVYLSHYGMKGV